MNAHRFSFKTHRNDPTAGAVRGLAHHEEELREVHGPVVVLVDLLEELQVAVVHHALVEVDADGLRGVSDGYSLLCLTALEVARYHGYVSILDSST